MRVARRVRRALPTWTRRGWFQHSVALVLFVGLAGAMFSSALFSTRAVFGGIGADPELFIWYLKYTPWALTHGHSLFLTSWIVYPQGANLMWNTSIILPAVIMSPVTAIFGPVAAWNALLVAAISSSAWAAYFAVGRLASSWFARIIGGLAYGFSPYMVNQSLGHAHLVVAWYPPVLLLLLDVIILRPVDRWRRTLGAALGAATAAQLLTGEEVLATSAIAAGVLLAVVGALHLRRLVPSLRRAWLLLGIALIVALTLSAYPLWIQFSGPQRVPGLLQPTNVYVSDVANFVVPTSMQALTTTGARELSAHFAGGSLAEADAYIGIPLIAVLAGAAALLWRSRVVAVATLTVAVLCLLTLGPHLHAGGQQTGIRLPWILMDRVPVLQNVLPVRLMLFVWLGIAAILAVLIDTTSWQSVRRSRAARVLVIAALLPLLPVFPFPVSNAAVPHYFDTAGDASRLIGSPVLTIAPFGNPHRAALWQAVSGMRFRMTEGMVFVPGPVFGSEPSALREQVVSVERGSAQPTLSLATRSAVLDVLRRDHVDEVVVGPYDDESTEVPPPSELTAANAASPDTPLTKTARVVALWRAILGREPELLDGVYVWEHIARQIGGHPWGAS
jgi:hypothetical protein